MQLVARCDEDFSEGTWRIDGGPGTTVELRKHELASGWFAPLDLAVTGKILDRGLRLVRDATALSYEPAPAVACRQADPQIGGYLSQPHAVMWEPQIALVPRSDAARIKEYLSRYTEHPVEIASGPASIPPEWAVTKPFRILTAPVNPPPEFARLVPRLVATTVLEGGLRLARNLYLTGGEPDALISSEGAESLVVELDGIQQPFGGGAVTLSLSELGLEPGNHEIRADVTRGFSTVDTLGDCSPPGAGSLAHRLSKHKGYKPETVLAEAADHALKHGAISLSGALARGDLGTLPLPDRPPLLLRAGALRYILLGSRSGELQRPGQMAAPPWLASIGLDRYFQFVELQPAFDAVWLLIEHSNMQREVRALTGALAPPARVPSPTDKEWATAIAQWRDAEVAADDASTWEQYQAIALDMFREEAQHAST